MIARRLESVTSVKPRSAEDGAAAEDSGRLLMKSRPSSAEATRAVLYYCVFHYITWMIKRSGTERAHVPPVRAPSCAFITRVLLCTLAEIQTVCRVRMWDGRWGRKQGGGRGFISYNYHQAIVQDSCGQYWRDPVSLKKALLVVEGDKGYIQAGSPSLSSLSGGEVGAECEPCSLSGFY